VRVYANNAKGQVKGAVKGQLKGQSYFRSLLAELQGRYRGRYRGIAGITKGGVWPNALLLYAAISVFPLLSRLYTRAKIF
jgi:hypothetical protein